VELLSKANHGQRFSSPPDICLCVHYIQTNTIVKRRIGHCAEKPLLVGTCGRAGQLTFFAEFPRALWEKEKAGEKRRWDCLAGKRRVNEHTHLISKVEHNHLC
jgi:hypothetical protein